MKTIQSFEDWNVQEKLVATLGTFDGMHLGHQFIIKDLKNIAQKHHAKTLLISLNPHPRIILNQAQHLKLIQTLEEKIQSIEKQGIDYLFLLPFDQSIAQIPAESFLKDILFGKLNIDTLLIGYDHHFGKNREGNFELVQSIAKQLNKTVIQLAEFNKDNQKVSSTIIRNHILEGNIRKANELLGYNFSISGKVIEGDKRGRQLGFPTANIFVEDPYKILPQNGVYICKVHVHQQIYHGVANLGIRPTFPTQKHQIEVHILDFHQQIYGEQVTLEFLEFIRPEKKFADLESLKKQIEQDVQNTYNYFKIKTL
ncbi:MAG: riboflavin biosynthesis protein [Bacteroidia bacterium]|nr:MAG: riboflavin biosynthesis protein [Bacteroidia bacterium]